MSFLAQAAKPSADIVADAVVFAGPCLYWGGTLTVGTADSSLIVYDNATEAAGTVVDRLTNNGVTAAGDTEVNHALAHPVVCVNGIYVDWTGTAAIGKIWYTPL